MQKTKYRGKLFCVYINGDVVTKTGENIGWVEDDIINELIVGDYNGVALDCLIKNNIKTPAVIKTKLKQFLLFVTKRITIKNRNYVAVKKAENKINNNEDLTASEKLVYEMSIKGYTAKQISEQIGIKPKTVYFIRWKIKNKLK
jgi:DNA-binding CsgD family transcriptional regulator